MKAKQEGDSQCVVEEVANNLFRIALPLPYFPRWVNVYVARGSDGAVVFDAGTDDPACREEFERGLKAIDVPFKAIQQVVITHLHIDHYGLAGWLSRQSGASVRLHEAATFLLDRHLRPEEWILEFSRFLRQHGTPSDLARELAQLEDWTPWLSSLTEYVPFTDGDVVEVGHRRWRAVHTPGHTADHACFHDLSSSMLIAGDHVLPDYSPHLRYVDVDMIDPVTAYLQGLDRVDSLQLDMVLPGHGRVILDSSARTHELRNEQQTLETELLGQLDDAKTAYELTLSHHGSRIPGFHLRLAIQQMVAQLRHLQLKGRVQALSLGGIVYYRKQEGRPRTWPHPGVVKVSEVLDGS